MPTPRLEVEGIWPCWSFCGLARSCFYGPGTLTDTILHWCLGGGVTVVAGGRDQGRLPCNGFGRRGEREVGSKGEKEIIRTQKAPVLTPALLRNQWRDLRSVTSFPDHGRVTANGLDFFHTLVIRVLGSRAKGRIWGEGLWGHPKVVRKETI